MTHQTIKKSLEVSKEVLFIYKPILIKVLCLEHPSDMLKVCIHNLAEDLKTGIIDETIFDTIDHLYFISDINIGNSDNKGIMIMLIDDKYIEDYMTIAKRYHNEDMSIKRDKIHEYSYKYNLYKILGADEFGNVGLDKDLLEA